MPCTLNRHRTCAFDCDCVMTLPTDLHSITDMKTSNAVIIDTGGCGFVGKQRAGCVVKRTSGICT